MTNIPSINPLYIQIGEMILKDIKGGKYISGNKLPSEQELSEIYDASRGTIRKALNNLMQDGHIETIHGKGSYVTGKKISSPIAQQLVSIEETLLEQNLKYVTKVLKKQVVNADESLRSYLQIGKNENQQLLYLERVRLIDNEPYILLHNWISLERVPGIQFYDYEQIGLFEAMEQTDANNISYGVRTFKAVIPSEKIADKIKVENEALLKIVQTTFNSNDIPLEHSDIYIKDGVYEVTSKLYR